MGKGTKQGNTPQPNNYEDQSKGPNDHQINLNDGSQNLDGSLIQSMKSMSAIYPNIHQFL